MASITAPTLTLRSTKGSPLTNAEVDANFTNISNAIATGQTAASYTAADVLAKLVTVDGSGSGLDADLLDGLNSATTNTASTIVARDASGNFAAGTITANLTGTASVASSLNYTVAVAGGGTGATTAAAARTNLGLVIGTDVQAYDAELAALASTTSAANALPYFTGAGTASTTTLSAYGRTLIDDADAATARSTLGLVIGTDVQGYDGDLAAIAALAGTSGMYVKTAANTAALRTLTAGTGITITNGDGAAGNPTISVTSYVSSVQGNTGAVTVSVPVTSVQGNTGAVTVNSVGYATSAGSATNATYASSAGGGWPTSLSGFTNNLGNYGSFFDGITNCGSAGGNSQYNAYQFGGYRSGNSHVHYYINCNCRCNC